MSPHPRSPRARVVLFFVLLAMGLAYIGVFAWFKQHSVDFVERVRNRDAAEAATAIGATEINWTFEQGSPALATLGTGWRPNEEGAWSRRLGGAIYLPASVDVGREVGIRFSGYLNPLEQEVTVTLDANGEMIGRWRLTPDHLEVVDRVRLPSDNPSGAPWRLEFAIARPATLLWRGYEPVFLIYGIYLRGVQTSLPAESGANFSQ